MQSNEILLLCGTICANRWAGRPIAWGQLTTWVVGWASDRFQPLLQFREPHATPTSLIYGQHLANRPEIDVSSVLDPRRENSVRAHPIFFLGNPYQCVAKDQNDHATLAESKGF